eukprot:47957_1
MKCHPKCNGNTILMLLCNVAIIIFFFVRQRTNIYFNQTLITTVNTTEIIPQYNNTKFVATLKETLEQTLNTISNISHGRTTTYPPFKGKLKSNHYDPLKTVRFIHSRYNRSNRLKIKIAIPTIINDHDNNLRKMQRQSWIKYLEPSYNIWNNTHSFCDISYNYFIGISNNTYENVTIDNENKIYNDIIRLNVTEGFDNLQIKTIDMLLSEYLIGKNNSFDLLLKTDSDSYVNVPNLCNFMVKLMDMNQWNGQSDALYLGKSFQHAIIHTEPHTKYENKHWMERVVHKEYSQFMVGFGYFVSFKTAEIIYNSLSATKYDIFFNRLEDTYLGHYLISFDVKFIDLSHIITPDSHPNVFGLNNYIIDHWYNNEKYSQLMVEKYKLHYILHQLYTNTNETYGYNPKMLLL